MVKLGILGSTRGTDLQALIDAIGQHALDAEIVQVISDRKKAYILQRAADHGLPSTHISCFTGEGKERRKLSREDYDRKLTEALKASQADLVLLIGFMRILSAEFCSQWKGRAVNVHPSLLPEYAGGMDGDVHAAVLRDKKNETGCTVHLATEEVDGGQFIVQKRCSVLSDDTPDLLKKRVQNLEGLALIEAVTLFNENGKRFPAEEGRDEQALFREKIDRRN